MSRTAKTNPGANPTLSPATKNPKTRARPEQRPKRSAPLPAANDASPNATASLIQLTRAIGEGLRLDVLKLLARESYAVSELCQILQIPQPALSHHLKVLFAAGLLSRRRESTSLFYRRVLQHPYHPNLVATLFDTIDALPTAHQQQTQVAAVHELRRARGVKFFTEHADSLAAHRTRICDPSTYAEAADELLSSMPGSRVNALEVGPGEGQLLALLADRYDAVLGIDSAAQMLEQAQQGVEHRDNVRLALQDVAQLTDTHFFDAIAAAMVLHHQPSPLAFFRHAQRLLKDQGHLIIVDLCPHDQEWVRKTCGDFWLGFEPDQLNDWGAACGFSRTASQYLSQNNGFKLQLHAFTKEQTT